MTDSTVHNSIKSRQHKIKISEKNLLLKGIVKSKVQLLICFTGRYHFYDLDLKKCSYFHSV